MKKTALKALLLSLFAWVVLVEVGGMIYAIHACGGGNSCGDDPGVGMVMFIYSAVVAIVSLILGVVYFFVNKSRGNK